MVSARLSRFLLRAAMMAALLLGLAGAPAAAQGSAKNVGRALSVCFLPDNGSLQAATLIREPGRFDCRTPQSAYGPGDFWVISEDIGQRSRSRAPLNARIASVWQDAIALHILYDDGHVATLDADGPGTTKLIQLGAVIEQPIPRSQAKVVRLMWHVKGSANMRGILLGPRLATERESAASNLTMAAIYAGFGGLCIALFTYNLALWGALRHRFQLYYCAMVAGLLLYGFSSSGALAWVWPDIANNDRLRFNYLMLGLTGAGALVFARSFFERRVFAGWLGRFTTLMASAMAAAAIGFFLFAPFAVHVVDLVFTGVFLGVAGVVFPMLWRAWRMRSNYLWLFAIAWSAPIVTAMLRALANLQIIAWNFWLDHSTVLAMSTEALLSSLAIAYRIKVLSRERDEALAAEAAALRLAETDPLTGLLNRRAFLEKAIGRAGDQVLQIADLDHFKHVNDTLGHDGGDEVLRLFARMLRNCAPSGALVARIGGEEFAILSAEGEAVESEIVLARLRATRMPFDLKLTTSIGSCVGPITTEVEWKALYRGADRALFEAKSAGRDRARAAETQEAA